MNVSTLLRKSYATTSQCKIALVVPSGTEVLGLLLGTAYYLRVGWTLVTGDVVELPRFQGRTLQEASFA